MGYAKVSTLSAVGLGVAIGGLMVNAQAAVGTTFTTVRAGEKTNLSMLVAFTLYDANVRAGSPTSGFLDMTASVNGSFGELGRVDVHRFIFDGATGAAPTGVSHSDAAFTEYVAAAAVPEPSSLGLLALGAGGLLARRRRAMAA